MRQKLNREFTDHQVAGVFLASFAPAVAPARPTTPGARLDFGQPPERESRARLRRNVQCRCRTDGNIRDDLAEIDHLRLVV
jgi:hypothetical protein